MAAKNEDIFDADELIAGRAVASLPRPKAPADLASRTLARIAASAPVKRTLWLLRPITNPFARCAAAAGIMLAVFPMTDLDMADKLGPRIEDRVVGSHVVDRVEIIVDDLLPTNSESYSQGELDALLNVRPASKPQYKIRPVKSHTQPRV